MSFNKSFLIGLFMGVALTMVTLDIWGRYLERSIVNRANPWLVEPFLGHGQPQMPKSSEKLPRPVLPADASAAHDHWAFHPLGGKPTTLGDFKGKVVFLNFWSTSCGPCIAEMPGIEKLQTSLRSEPVAFLAVTEEDEQSVGLFLQKFPLRVPVYLADTDAPRAFGPQIVPRTFILDRSGREVFRDVGGLNWDDDNARKFIRGLEAQ